jgi:hypothetical protein
MTARWSSADEQRAVNRLRERIEILARKKYGKWWRRSLAKAAGWPPATLYTFLSRGQTYPRADRLRQLERALGIAGSYRGFAQPSKRPSVADLQQEIRRLRFLLLVLWLAAPPEHPRSSHVAEAPARYGSNR